MFNHGEVYRVAGSAFCRKSYLFTLIQARPLTAGFSRLPAVFWQKIEKVSEPGCDYSSSVRINRLLVKAAHIRSRVLLFFQLNLLKDEVALRLQA